VHVGDNTTRSDSGLSEALVELFIILDGELDVARTNAVLLVILGSIASELEKFGCQILKDGSHVDRGTSTNTTSEATFLQITGKTTDREGEASLG
jgi:hypothetical protein